MRFYNMKTNRLTGRPEAKTIILKFSDTVFSGGLGETSINGLRQKSVLRAGTISKCGEQRYFCLDFCFFSSKEKKDEKIPFD